MKNGIQLLAAFLLIPAFLLGQTTFQTDPDTLLYQNFQADTIDVPAGIPSGNDLVWINYDEDGYPEICDSEGDHYGWLPVEDINDSLNYTYSSCSWNRDQNGNDCPDRNRNWLITPPISIVHGATFLHWKSLTFYGPYWVDGYKVLVSTTENLPEAFTDTLFVAAETINLSPAVPLLDPNVQTYSSGYVHADHYTLTDYYELSNDGANDFLKGKLEPHRISLEKYVGKTIYIAFLHDAYCDYLMQLDDVVVVDEHTIPTQEPIFDGEMQVFPNPAHESAFATLEMKKPAKARLAYLDVAGRIIYEKWVQLSGGKNVFQLDLRSTQPGAYILRLQTESDQIQSLLIIR